MPIKTYSTTANRVRTQHTRNLKYAIYNCRFAIVYFLIYPALLLYLPPAVAEEARAFQEGRFDKGELRYINDLPVLIVSGTPEEIGRQKAALTGDVVHKLADYPKQLMRIGNGSKALGKASRNGQGAQTAIPPRLSR